MWIMTKTKAIQVPFRKSFMDVMIRDNKVKEKSLQKGLVLVYFAFNISSFPGPHIGNMA